jgi:glutathione S-transferase
MPLTLYFHPLSSYCQKVVVALYENGTAFVPQLVDLSDEASSAELKRLWPIGKFPVLHDSAGDRTVPESSIIIEYLDQHYPGTTRFIPADREQMRETRLRDRFFDLYLHLPMQRIVGERLRAADKKDPHGLAEARTTADTALGMVEQQMAARHWAMGDAFTIADCSAAPPLFYLDKIAPLGSRYPNAAAYLDRLKQRPSYARVLQEAEPYMQFFPKG